MNLSKHKMSVLTQIVKLIPGNLIPKLAAEHGVDKQSRSFSPTSHLVSLLFGQLSHALGLNDICDTLQNHSGVLTTIRNQLRPIIIREELYMEAAMEEDIEKLQSALSTDPLVNDFRKIREVCRELMDYNRQFKNYGVRSQSNRKR